MLDRYSDNGHRRDVPSFIEPRPPLIQNPFMRPRPQKGTNLLELFEEDSEIEEPELVQVYLRVKPCDVRSNLYEIRNDKCLVTTLDTTTAGHGRRTQHNLSKMYTFSKIFGPESSQRGIFEHVVKDNLKKLTDGNSFTLLTYGASGSGKTYTLMGTVSSPGLVPRSLEYVFKLVDAAQQPAYKPSDGGADKLSYDQQEFELQWVKRLRHISAPLRDKYRRMSAQLRNDLTESQFDLTNRTKYYVWVSFVEIYNEAVYDLLAPPDKRAKLRIREDPSGNVYVKGATQAFVRSGEEAYDVMVAGKHNLVVAATGVHAHSSRSHCIFTITVLTETENGVRPSCVRLCDLAGSERARATRNTGQRMAESRNINASLHVLERCLHLLRRNQRQNTVARVPYRESKLTRLLGSGLSGSRGEAVSMVVTLNPAPEYALETKHVLSLAAVAQDIQINNTMYTTTLESSGTQDTTICSNAEVMKLRSDNELLHFELLQAQARNKELLAAMEEKQEESANTMRELVEEAKDMTRQYYEAQLDALRSEMEDMIEEYECRLNKVSAPPPSTGTPTRFLQSKVSHLMTEIAVLEETLSVERLARARAEKEVQHLRSCIEERDEKAFKESAISPAPEDQETEENEMVLTDSEDDTSDPFNESLEPAFKKEGLNVSIAVSKQTEVSETSVHNETMEPSVNQNESIVSYKEVDKSNDTVKYEDCDSTPRNSSVLSVDEAKGKDSRDVSDNDEKGKDIDDVKKQSNGFNEDFDDDDVQKKQSNDFGDVSGLSSKIDDEIIAQSKLNDFQDSLFLCESVVDTKNDVTNETDQSKSVADDKSMIDINEKDSGLNDDSHNDKEEEFIVPKLKLSNLTRGTYYVHDSVLNDKQKIDVDTTENKPTKVSETFVSKIIKSFKSTASSDTSLRQFEMLEQATKNVDETNPKNVASDIDIKISKKTRTFFDEKVKLLENIETEVPKKAEAFIDEIKHEIVKNANSPKKAPKDVKNDTEELIKNPLTEKRTYFDNIDTVEPLKNKAICDIKFHARNEERSPSIVKDDVDKDFEPTTIKKLLGESINKSEMLISKNKTLSKKYDSIDMFESPQVDKHPIDETNDMVLKSYEIESKNIEEKPNKLVREVSNVDAVRNSIQKLVLGQKTRNDVKGDVTESNSIEIKHDTKLKMEIKGETKLFKTGFKSEANVTDVQNNEENKDIVITETKSDQTMSETQKDNTIDEFDNLYKNLSTQRATEFDLLVTQEINPNDLKDFKENEAKEKPDEVKYNLRHKSKSVLNNSDKNGNLNSSNDKSKEIDEVLLESNAKCEAKGKTTKRSLRLRRRKNQEDDTSDQDSYKLKDIVNLKKEFSDVTLGLPAEKTVVKDIPSPEKFRDEENLPPLMGIQSCPSKSVTRSRRKLFTPRAETLEESLSQTGDSNERVCVPRPSYHRARARRKL